MAMQITGQFAVAEKSQEPVRKILEKLKQFKPEFNKSMESILHALDVNGRGSRTGKSFPTEDTNARNKTKALENKINKVGKLLYTISDRKLFASKFIPVHQVGNLTTFWF